ncbi:MAG: hypothetical protein HY707_08645 [Ignavibacteriae bacterium]|nr:hypothetical protein [Ignavibacteriota bacterium]
MDLVFQIIFTFLGAFLSVVLTTLLIQTGKAIQDLGARMDERTAKIAELVDERTAKIAELIVTEADKTRELIKTLKGSV